MTAGLRLALIGVCVLGALSPMAAAQSRPAPHRTDTASAPAVSPPPGYLIGPNDVLSVMFWRNKDMSTEQVVVRPDGYITLPLLNDIHAAGLTPEALRLQVLDEARRFVEEPAPTIIIKEIHSRQVFITGQVEKPGTYQLTDQMTVMQLIALAGGVKEFAEREQIVVMRTEAGRQVLHKFNYKWVLKGLNLSQNIVLRPGDTVVVP